jgi:hypothetical protein
MGRHLLQLSPCAKDVMDVIRMAINSIANLYSQKLK